MVVLLILLLIVGEAAVSLGGLWLIVTLAREGAWLTATFALLLLIPSGWWLGDQILRRFTR